MRIKNIHINGFRQLNPIDVCFEEDITVIAGGNNSGKTSLTELLGYVFDSTQGKFTQSDIPIQSCEKWANVALDAILRIFSNSTDKKKRLADIVELLFPSNDAIMALTIPPVEVKIQVDYTAGVDDIRNFADYLMDFDGTKSSLFFIFRYTIKRDLFQKKIEEAYDKLALRIESYEKSPLKQFKLDLISKISL